MKNSCFLWKIYLILLLLIGGTWQTLLCSQGSAILSKLDYTNEKLKTIEKYHEDGNQSAGLRALLRFYQQNDDLYKRIYKADLYFLSQEYLEDIELSLSIADQTIDKYFLFREEWDMERTNVPYQFEGEIDWEMNPFGDPEWTWMLNRHKYWTHLGKAYFFTKEEKYAESFVRQVTHWIDNNPLPTLEDKYNNTAAWRRIEAGIRCENWIKSFEFIKKSIHFTPEFLDKFLNALLLHGAYLNNAFSNFSKTSNWGVLEYHGLFNLSIFLKDFKIADKWQTNAIDRLGICIDLQVLEDGAHWEQSPMYHNEVLHCFMNVILLSKRSNIELPENIIDKTKAMAYANLKWQKPNYHQPLLGDSDDTDLRGLLTFAAFLFEDEVIKSRAFEKLDFESYIILGKENQSRYSAIRPKLPRFLSVYQEQTGGFYMRNSWNENAVYSSLQLKKLGCGHGHDNLLHFTLFANGKDYLIDGGRYTYIDNKWREYFKSSKSHNTLGVDNLPNSIYKDSWTNSYEAKSDGDFAIATEEYDYAEAINTAYKRLDDPVYLKRRFLYLKPSLWLIFDSYTANKEHVYTQYYNFPNTKVKIDDKSIVTTYSENNLRVDQVNQAQIVVSDAWWSPEYNLKLPSKRVEVFNKVTGFNSFISIVYFPDKTHVKFKKIPVYSRKNVLLPSSEVEAVELELDEIKYTFIVVHNSSSPANQFYLVHDHFVQGEVILMKEIEGKMEINKIIN